MFKFVIYILYISFGMIRYLSPSTDFPIYLFILQNSALPEQHNSVTRKLSFDINKGSEHVSFHISL